MRVLVTGGSGFLGSYVVELLEAGGHQPIVLDRSRPAWTPEVQWVPGDVAEALEIQHAFDGIGPDAVVHLAGVLGTSETFGHPQDTVRTNVIGTVNVLEACRARPGVRYVGVQTGALWLSPYAISKRAATDLARGYAREFGIPATVMKVFNAYGPRQDGTGAVNKLVPRFAVNAVRSEPLPIFGDGEQPIDLVYARDCAEAFVRALDKAPGNGEVIDVGSGESITVLDVARRVIEIVGGGEVRFLARRLGEGPEYPVADTTSSRELLGFVPKARLDLLPDTVSWYRERESVRGTVTSGTSSTI